MSGVVDAQDPTDSERLVSDPFGAKIRLAICNGKDTKRFLAGPQALSRFSRIFTASVVALVTAKSDESVACLALRLQVDNIEVMSLVLRMVHGKFDKIPAKMSQAGIFAFAKIVHTSVWAAWVLGDQDFFEYGIRKLLLNWRPSRPGHINFHDVEPSLVGLLAEFPHKRDEVVKGMVTVFTRKLTGWRRHGERLCEMQGPEHSVMCEEHVFHAISQSLDFMGIRPSSTLRDLDDESVMSLSEQLLFVSASPTEVMEQCGRICALGHLRCADVTMIQIFIRAFRDELRLDLGNEQLEHFNRLQARTSVNAPYQIYSAMQSLGINDSASSSGLTEAINKLENFIIGYPEASGDKASRSAIHPDDKPDRLEGQQRHDMNHQLLGRAMVLGVQKP
ncbi:hypothetical protein TruAng_005192 [Truncatella angustata]|nr:hypothetical protein TruAng_005192 [Truncatella angustata]